MNRWMKKETAGKDGRRKISRKAAAAALAAVLAAALAVGGVSAYFTDRETAVNTFVIGKISLELQEPDWNPDAGRDMVPGQTVKKNPLIVNDGVNPEFVFAEVKIPYRNVVTANDDGTKNAAADTELYRYTVNEGWFQLSVARDTVEKTMTYVYVYGNEQSCARLEPGAATPPVFDTVTLANLVEDQALEEVTLEISVNAYGIQAENLNGGETEPLAVWGILSNQLADTGRE